MLAWLISAILAPVLGYLYLQYNFSTQVDSFWVETLKTSHIVRPHVQSFVTTYYSTDVR